MKGGIKRKRIKERATLNVFKMLTKCDNERDHNLYQITMKKKNANPYLVSICETLSAHKVSNLATPEMIRRIGNWVNGISYSYRTERPTCF